MKVDVLRTLGGELLAEDFGEKFKKLARRAQIPVKPGRHFPRDGLGQPKRFFCAASVLMLKLTALVELFSSDLISKTAGNGATEFIRRVIFPVLIFGVLSGSQRPELLTGRR
jgi:hypothetical protein